MMSKMDRLMCVKFSHGPDLRFCLNFSCPWPVYYGLALFRASIASPTSSSWKRQRPGFNDSSISYCCSTAKHFVKNCFLLCVFQETKLLNVLMLKERAYKIWVDVHQFYCLSSFPIREHLVFIVFGGRYDVGVWELSTKIAYWVYL